MADFETFDMGATCVHMCALPRPIDPVDEHGIGGDFEVCWFVGMLKLRFELWFACLLSCL